MILRPLENKSLWIHRHLLEAWASSHPSTGVWGTLFKAYRPRAQILFGLCHFKGILLIILHCKYCLLLFIAINTLVNYTLGKINFSGSTWEVHLEARWNALSSKQQRGRNTQSTNKLEHPTYDLMTYVKPCNSVDFEDQISVFCNMYFLGSKLLLK